MRCPTDKTLLLKNSSDKPLYHCSDCSGVFVSHSVAGLDSGSILDAPASRLCCPKDGSRLRMSETEGVFIHICGKCKSAWIDGESQEKLMSKLPHWFGKPRDKTVATTAGALALDAIVTILWG